MIKQPKIVFKEYTAGEITKMALTYLTTALQYRVRRVNNVPFKFRRNKNVVPGWSDIQGYDPNAIAILCETKTINDRLSKEQIERLDDLKKCGGKCYIATQDKSTGEFVILIY